MSTETTSLNRALAAENLSFSTYSLLHAMSEHGGPMSVSAISLASGCSYWAVRNQIRRTSWFLNIGRSRHTAVVLTLDGQEKLARVKRRLAADHR